MSGRIRPGPEERSGVSRADRLQAGKPARTDLPLQGSPLARRLLRLGKRREAAEEALERRIRKAPETKKAPGTN